MPPPVVSSRRPSCTSRPRNSDLLKLPNLFILILPGVMATALYADLERPDFVFPALAFDVLPVGVRGLILAGIFWPRTMDFDPYGTRLPIKIDAASNGEYAPRPLTALQETANRHARDCCRHAARRLGMDRRSFLKPLSGGAATLLAFNEVHARAGARGGSFLLPAATAFD